MSQISGSRLGGSDQAQRIVLTRRWPAAAEQAMAQLGELTRNAQDLPFTAEQLVDALAEFDVLGATVTDQIDAAVLSAAAGRGLRTRLIANFGVGFNHIDIQQAQSLGIAVTNTPGVLTDATAELALTLLLMCARRAAEGERHLRSGEWQGWSPTHMLSTGVTGKTLGIVGMGRIGTALARKCHHGLGMRVIYYNRSPSPAAAELHAERVSLTDLLQAADFVSLHCPATADTRHLIDAKALSMMSAHSFLINTARGDVVDEAALVAALERDAIAGAGLDVYEQEPNVHPGLMALRQAVLLPHMGSGTQHTRLAMGLRAVANVQAFVEGESPQDLVSGG